MLIGLGEFIELIPSFIVDLAAGLYTVASFLETVFWGQMTASPHLFTRSRHGSIANSINGWIIAAIVGAAGIPFLPFWGALADRYSRQPIVVRSFFVYLLAGMTPSWRVMCGSLSSGAL